MAQRRDPIPPSTPGARVLDRDPTVLAGYHPSGRPVGAAYDRDRIRTKAASTSPERVSGLRLPRRAARDGTRPTGTEYCCRRFGGGLQNAELAFQSPWYKFETPCPLVRPSQTHLWRSARAPVDRGPWGLGEGVVGRDHPPGRSALGTPSASTALGGAPRAGARPPMCPDPSGNQNRPSRAPRAHSPCKIATYPGRGPFWPPRGARRNLGLRFRLIRAVSARRATQSCTDPRSGAEPSARGAPVGSGPRRRGAVPADPGVLWC